MYATASNELSLRPGPYGALFLKNYKAFGPSGQSLSLSRINLFFGPNSSGKSSVFKAIKLVVNAFFGKALTDHAYSTTVHKGKRDEEIVIGLCFRHPHKSIESTPTLFFKFTERPDDRIGLDVVDVVLPNRITLQLKPATDGLILAACALPRDALRDLLPSIHQNLDDRTLENYVGVLTQAVSTSQSALDIFFPKVRFLASAEGVPHEIVTVIEAVIAEGLYVARDNLGHLRNNLVHLPPIRRIPTRTELRKLSQTETNFLDDVETRAWEVLLKTRYQRFLKEINIWMGDDGLRLGYELLRRADKLPEENRSSEADPPAYLVVRDNTDPQMSAVELDLTDVGVGISQVVPVIGTACVHNELWIMLEQPELHLHPKVQCQLGDLFIAKSKDDLHLGNFNSSNVFFIETHSEHLVLRMLRRVRETSDGVRNADHPFALNPEDLSVFCFEPNRDRGAQIQRMEITPDGDFSHAWPNGFFPERLRELR